MMQSSAEFRIAALRASLSFSAASLWARSMMIPAMLEKIGFPIAVVYKYFDDHGPYLAAILPYYAFIAIFPLRLISSSILGFVLGEAALLGLAGGMAGALLAYPLVEHPLSRYFEESMHFAPLHVPLAAAIGAVLVGVALGAVAAALPALRASRLEVVNALRRIA